MSSASGTLERPERKCPGTENTSSIYQEGHRGNRGTMVE
jgi:hypothetical protein